MSKEAEISQSTHICGKKFATAKAVYGHQMIHSGLQRTWGLNESRVCSISTSAKEISIESETLDPLRRGSKPLSLRESSSFMTEIEKHEMNEAAMSLVMFSERVFAIRNLPPGDVDMDSEIKPVQEKIIQKQESTEVLSHSSFEKFTTCSDAIARALPSPMRRSKLQKKRLSNSNYKRKIYGESLERSQALAGHQTLHRSIKGQLALKDFEGGDSLSVLTDSDAKKPVPQPSCFEVSQVELTELRDTNVKEHCAVSKRVFTELFSHSGFEKSGTSSDVVAPALPSPLRSELPKKPQTQSNSSYKFKISGKSFRCSQALGHQQTLHRPISVILERKRRRFEDGNSPSGSSEANKIVSQPSSVEVAQEELIDPRDTNVKEHFVEFSKVFSHSGFENFSTCSDVVAQALPSLLKSNLQKKPQSNSSYKCKTCGKSFGCFQALGGHQRLHRPIKKQLEATKEAFRDCNSLYDSSEAKKIVSQPSIFEVSLSGGVD